MPPPEPPPGAAPQTRSAAPAAALRPHVQAYVEQAVDVPPGREVRIVQSANVDPVACVTVEGQVRIGLGAGFLIPPVTIAGAIPCAIENVFAGRVRGFFVRFTPVGALALLGVRAGPAAGGPPRFDAAVRPAQRAAAARWGDEVRAAPDFAACVRATDAFLLGGLAHVPPRAARLRAAVDLLEAASGAVRPAELAAAAGVAESTLRRWFREDLGVSAKLFGRIVRFRHAHAYLHTTPGATWADAVVRFGYADQAHLTKDYRRFAGEPPTRWQPDARVIDRTFGIEERAGRAE